MSRVSWGVTQMTQGGAAFEPEMRAGDADRERLVEQLREHHAAGRLTLDEFEERMVQAYSAKTYGELRVLTRDLPIDLAQLNLQQAQQRTAPGRPVEIRRDGAGRMQINIDNQAIQDRINDHLARHQDKHRHHLARHQDRIERHQQRWEQRAARRGRGWDSFGSWIGLSVLLTTIWLITGLSGGGSWGNFWPIWPIGITGALMVAHNINNKRN
ncbi:hypothetical protein GCM10009839_20660 [Catenulispora yoronensis]|uniref:DUF1707 domain-containing protein n=1 Tax=Catenulispora yoronensis TaxID=450799 RepID=A0ABP5FE45_9ACTN